MKAFLRIGDSVSCIRSDCDILVCFLNSVVAITGSKEVLSTCIALCSGSLSDTDMTMCNFRFNELVESNVGGKLWTAISKIGVVL